MISVLLLNSFLVLPADLPESQRIEFLSSYFDPPPGQEVALEFPAAKSSEKDDFSEIKGQLIVNPPKGQCLLIRYDDNIPDQKICHSTPFYFFLKNLDDKSSSFTLRVISSDETITRLTWSTPHSLGQVLRYDKDTPQLLPVHHCNLKKIDADQSVISISLFNHDIWTFLMPKPNERKEITDFRGEKLHLAESVRPEKKFHEVDLASGKVKAIKQVVKLDWYIQGDKITETKGARLSSDYASVPNKKTICRYRYGDIKEKNAFGELECLNTSVYEKVYIPLKCLVH